MDKKRIEIIATVILIIIFILAWANAFKIIKKRAPAKANASLEVQVSKVSAHIIPAAAKTVPAEGVGLEDYDWIRDPFSGKIYSGKEEIVDLRLSGIVWDEKNPSALVNGEVVQENDTVGPYKVIKIYRDKVVFSSATKNFELKLQQ